MKTAPCAGITLIELLVAMAIAALVGTMILQMVISFQSQILAEISRNDLQDRADRLIRFLANDISGSAFLLGAAPRTADGSAPVLVHNSLAGNPLRSLPFSLLAEDNPTGDDQLTIVKAVSFSPTIYLAQPAFAGESELVLNRRPNQSPGSTRELQPAPAAINHLVLANQHACYSVHLAGLVLQLVQPLQNAAPADTELLGVRAYTYQLDPFADSKRLRRDDFTSRDILDDAVDGLQFEYLLADGSMVQVPSAGAPVRAVRISLLVRDLRADHNYRNERVYTLANSSYGPFQDNYRRLLVSRLVEVKNHAL